MAERPLKIGIISGSQRPVQAGTQITDFIQAVIEKHIKADQSIELVRINLGEVELPLYDEPSPPMQITASDQYTKSTTQAWSRTVSPLNAFVVVTPEYNCNLPAGLKNAIDVLWHEWTTKPFMIVSYAVMGGTFAYEDLKRALSMAVKARVVDTNVHLQFGPLSNGNMIKAATGQDLSLTPDGTDHLWSDKRPAVIQAWQELVDLVNATDKVVNFNIINNRTRHIQKTPGSVYSWTSMANVAQYAVAYGQCRTKAVGGSLNQDCDYVRRLGFNERPDYAHLLQLFRRLFRARGFKYDAVFDWTEKLFHESSTSNSVN